MKNHGLNTKRKYNISDNLFLRSNISICQVFEETLEDGADIHGWTASTKLI